MRALEKHAIDNTRKKENITAVNLMLECSEVQISALSLYQKMFYQKLKEINIPLIFNLSQLKICILYKQLSSNSDFEATEGEKGQ